jgi:IS1 family transposase
MDSVFTASWTRVWSGLVEDGSLEVKPNSSLRHLLSKVQERAKVMARHLYMHNITAGSNRHDST